MRLLYNSSDTLQWACHITTTYTVMGYDGLRKWSAHEMEFWLDQRKCQAIYLVTDHSPDCFLQEWDCISGRNICENWLTAWFLTEWENVNKNISPILQILGDWIAELKWEVFSFLFTFLSAYLNEIIKLL